MNIIAVLALLIMSVGAFQGMVGPKRLFGGRSLSMEQKGRVTVYTKETCPHCEKAKDLLTNKYGLDIVEVDVLGEKSEDILQQMRQFSGGRNTVPQVFFNEVHLGGNDDVQGLDADGTLADKVEMVKSTPVTMMQDHWYHPWY